MTDRDELERYKLAWKEVNRVLPPSKTGTVRHDCDTDHDEEDVDLLDCIAERFGIDQ